MPFCSHSSISRLFGCTDHDHTKYDHMDPQVVVNGPSLQVRRAKPDRRIVLLAPFTYSLRPLVAPSPFIMFTVIMVKPGMSLSIAPQRLQHASAAPKFVAGNLSSSCCAPICCLGFGSSLLHGPPFPCPFLRIYVWALRVPTWVLLSLAWVRNTRQAEVRSQLLGLYAVPPSMFARCVPRSKRRLHQGYTVKVFNTSSLRNANNTASVLLEFKRPGCPRHPFILLAVSSASIQQPRPTAWRAVQFGLPAILDAALLTRL